MSWIFSHFIVTVGICAIRDTDVTLVASKLPSHHRGEEGGLEKIRTERWRHLCHFFFFFSISFQVWNPANLDSGRTIASKMRFNSNQIETQEYKIIERNIFSFELDSNFIFRVYSILSINQLKIDSISFNSINFQSPSDIFIVISNPLINSNSLLNRITFSVRLFILHMRHSMLNRKK